MMKFLYNLVVPIILFFASACNSSKHFSLDESNFVSVSGPITRPNVDSVIQQLYSNHIQNYIHKNKKILLYIDSPGGSVHEGMRLIQTIKNLQQKNITVDCIAENFMSMAFIIFQVCDSRNILDHSIGMQHQMNLAIKGDIENVKSYFDMIFEINEQIIDMEIKRIGISYTDYRNKIIQDWWLYGYDNIYNNVADNVATVDCTPNLVSKSIVRKENFLGFTFMLQSSACPLLKEKKISEPKLIMYYDESNYANGKMIREINSF